MVKLIVVFFAAVACIQLLKPLGLPGLKYRRDAWKLVAAGFFSALLLIAMLPAWWPEW